MYLLFQHLIPPKTSQLASELRLDRIMCQGNWVRLVQIYIPHRIGGEDEPFSFFLSTAHPHTVERERERKIKRETEYQWNEQLAATI